MKACWHVALDLLHEALYRRWLLAMFVTITLLVVVLAFSLQLDVVDGVIAGTRFFGDDLGLQLRTADSMLRPLLIGMSWTIYVAGLLFGMLACSNFAPELLAPGRIEHLLSLPVRRWQLILGTYVGVMAIAVLSALYAGITLSLLVGFKAGVWSIAPITAGLSASVGFSAIYGAMLAAAVLIRNPGASVGFGAIVLALGSALPRAELAAMFDPGWTRDLYCWSVAWLPRFTALGDLGISAAGLEQSTSSELSAAISAAFATPLFGLACVALAVWQLEGKDY